MSTTTNNPTFLPASKEDIVRLGDGIELVGYQYFVLTRFVKRRGVIERLIRQNKDKRQQYDAERKSRCKWYKLCNYDSCWFPSVKEDRCNTHRIALLCSTEGCKVFAVTNDTKCVAHGGGNRCSFEGCTNGARSASPYCEKHLGRRLCIVEECTTPARERSDYCTKHGGGNRCKYPSCETGALSASNYCAKHGGKRCKKEGCTNLAAKGGHCHTHEGGRRCDTPGCGKVAISTSLQCREHSPLKIVTRLRTAQTTRVLQRRKKDPEFDMLCRLRSRLLNALNGSLKVETTKILLGCTLAEFKQHLQVQFGEGMTWENRQLWHIDHIIPCSKFNLLNSEHQKVCFNWRNTQPLWAGDNLKKHTTKSTILDPELASMIEKLQLKD